MKHQRAGNSWSLFERRGQPVRVPTRKHDGILFNQAHIINVATHLYIYMCAPRRFYGEVQDLFVYQVSFIPYTCAQLLQNLPAVFTIA